MNKQNGMHNQNENATFENKAVEYESGGIPVRLTPGMVKRYICKNANVTDEEIVMFLKLCESQKLNPFLREVYLLKFDKNPATMVTGKDVFTKRAFQNPKFAGFQAGIIVLDKGGEIQYRNGSFKLKGETITGGWCKVFIKGYDVTIDAEVSMDEYGKTYGTWQTIPATMIRKVALVQALREAFPEDLGGLYDSSEMGTNSEMLDETPIVIEGQATERYNNNINIDAEYENTENAQSESLRAEENDRKERSEGVSRKAQDNPKPNVVSMNDL